MQDENGFTSCPCHVYMGGSVIVWIDDNAQAIETQDSGHGPTLPKPKGLGKMHTC